MLRNMVTSLIKHERIMTTTAKAKELRKVADQMVTHAKIGNNMMMVMIWMMRMMIMIMIVLIMMTRMVMKMNVLT
jgi:ribosomal protein L17